MMCVRLLCLPKCAKNKWCSCKVIHMCAAAAALLRVLRAHGRKANGRGAGERARERARSGFESAAVLHT